MPPWTPAVKALPGEPPLTHVQVEANALDVLLSGHAGGFKAGAVKDAGGEAVRWLAMSNPSLSARSAGSRASRTRARSGRGRSGGAEVVGLAAARCAPGAAGIASRGAGWVCVRGRITSDQLCARPCAQLRQLSSNRLQPRTDAAVCAGRPGRAAVVGDARAASPSRVASEAGLVRANGAGCGRERGDKGQGAGSTDKAEARAGRKFTWHTLSRLAFLAGHARATGLGSVQVQTRLAPSWPFP